MINLGYADCGHNLRLRSKNVERLLMYLVLPKNRWNFLNYWLNSIYQNQSLTKPKLIFKVNKPLIKRTNKFPKVKEKSLIFIKQNWKNLIKYSVTFLFEKKQEKIGLFKLMFMLYLFWLSHGKKKKKKLSLFHSMSWAE